MAANSSARLASVTAAAYAVLVVSSAFLHFSRTGSLPGLVHRLSHPGVWVAFLVAALVAWGLWKHYAWAWWLGLAAALFQLFRIVSWYVQGPLGRVPGTYTLIAVALLVLLLVLLAQRRVRLACSR